MKDFENWRGDPKVKKKWKNKISCLKPQKNHLEKCRLAVVKLVETNKYQNIPKHFKQFGGLQPFFLEVFGQ